MRIAKERHHSKRYFLGDSSLNYLKIKSAIDFCAKYYSTTVNSTLKGPESNIMFLQPATAPSPVAEQKTDEPLSLTVKSAISPVVSVVIVTAEFS